MTRHQHHHAAAVMDARLTVSALSDDFDDAMMEEGGISPAAFDDVVASERPEPDDEETGLLLSPSDTSRPSTSPSRTTMPSKSFPSEQTLRWNNVSRRDGAEPPGTGLSNGHDGGQHDDEDGGNDEQQTHRASRSHSVTYRDDLVANIPRRNGVEGGDNPSLNDDASSINSSSARFLHADDGFNNQDSSSAARQYRRHYGSILFDGGCPFPEHFEPELHGSSEYLRRSERRQSLTKRRLSSDGAEEGSTSSALRRRSMSVLRRLSTALTLSDRSVRHTRAEHCFADARNLAEGTIPQGIVLAISIGIVCGLAAYVYYTLLESLLDGLWHTLPQRCVVSNPHWSEEYYVLWIPLVGMTCAMLVGLSVKYLGEPGDLAYTVGCVHEKGYVPMEHAWPMVVASQFSILAGGSLGPEAPLVAICASLGGFISRRVFRQRNKNVVRKHTLMGMAGALAAFFGVPLGGSLFALEVCSRFGLEYFEHVVEAIFCGEVTLFVFRGVSGLPIAPIWHLETPPLTSTDATNVGIGALIGLLGAGVAYLFATFHWCNMSAFQHFGLVQDNNRAVARALVGACAVVSLGMLIPHTMFWGESEIQQILTMSPASELEHVWPTSGLIGFEMNSCWKCIAIGVAKLVAISFTVAGGYRGGFIFPFFAAGAAFGRALVYAFPSLPVPLACLCFSAGINVAITRTSLATTLILSYLAGEQNALPSILAASLVSLFATSYMPFIKTQIVRSDIDYTLYYKKRGGRFEDESLRNKPQNTCDESSSACSWDPL